MTSSLTPPPGSVTIVTPWHNHLEYADAYWHALDAGHPDDVIVVDNGSQPPLDFAVIRLPENEGFCYACNAGLIAASTEYVVFLNNDIELRRPSWLDEIRAVLAPKRLVGEMIHGYHTRLDGTFHSYIDGWCIGGRREDLLELGAWDETLCEPAYYSDNLLSLKAERAGWELACVSVGLRHIVNGTSRDDHHALHQASINNREVWKQAVRQTPVSIT